MIKFPSEAAVLHKQLQAEKPLTLVERLHTAADTTAALEALSIAGDARAGQQEYQRRLEEEWRQRIREFIQRHVRVDEDRWSEQRCSSE